MRLISALPFLLIAVPLAEIGMFILVGGLIGVLPTIGLVLATALGGATLLRVQGLGQLERIRAALAAGAMPARDLSEGAMILVAGVLLLTPGFITDTLGLTLFVPAVRRALHAALARRVGVMAGDGPANRRPAGPGVIDLDASDYAPAPDRDAAGR